MRAVQQFSDEYLAQARQATPEQILAFLEQFRLLQAAVPVTQSKSKLISMKIPEDLLEAFRAKCEISGVKYQTQIKTLMRQWLENEQA
jgi:uncharacterized protein (DUF4415 family)